MSDPVKLSAPNGLVLGDRPAEGIVRLTLNRPEKLNALSAELMEDLQCGLESVAEDDECRVIVVTGAGRGFSAGLDLESGFSPPEFERSGRIIGSMEAQERVARALTTPRRLRIPVIAAVNGPAAGGGLSLALACDVRIAARSAHFSVAFVRVGLSGCDCGVSYLLPKVVGSGHAFEMMLTGCNIDSEHAFRIGLVSSVVDSDRLEAASLEVAERIAYNSPYGVEMTKDVMWRALDSASLEDAIALENRTQILTTLTEDQPEAVTAFREKRSPGYQRR